MKMALYSRVSKRRGQNPENQTLILRNHAERMNWEYEMFVEKESTRKTRPIKQELLTRLRNGEFDGVCIVKLDRWARSLQELIMDVTELHNKNISFIAIRDNIDFSTATGKLQFHILAAFSEFERELIRERTLDGLERAKRKGVILGRPRGSKDKSQRKRSGYWLRHASKQTVNKYQGRIIDESERKH